MKPKQDRSKFGSEITQEMVWQPRLYTACLSDERRELEGLRQNIKNLRIHDTLHAQLEELIVGRMAPEKDKLTVKDRTALVDQHLFANPAEEYGAWVYYPWSGNLVHVLPEAEFREVRSSRNLYLISPVERQRLISTRIGVIGLSVGRAILTTLALEGIGGTFRLADFDHLELSNMNRLHGSVHDLGVHKVVLAARELFEMDPFLKVQIFPDGLTEDNIHKFLEDDGKLDLLVEECDDLFMKIFARERARELGIPVVMSTSDRGLLDVERFDLEPQRPVLHGLLDQAEAKNLKGLITKEKVPYVIDVLDPDRLSDRMLASLVEIDETIVTWPQLASAVVLGGAIAADVARRILLGEMSVSGRFYVDLSELIADNTAWTPSRKMKDLEFKSSTAEVSIDTTAKQRKRSLNIDNDEVRSLVEYATLAPSGGNSQPWRFVYDGLRLACYRDPERGGMLDFCGWYSQLAIGAAVENLNLAAGAMGIETVCNLLPDGPDSTLISLLELRRAKNSLMQDPLFKQVTVRITNRRIGRRTVLPQGDKKLLEFAAQEAGAELRLQTCDTQLGEIGKILGEVDRILMLEPKFHAALMSELRWSPAEAILKRDGLDVRSLELSKLDRAALNIVARPRVVEAVGRLGGGGALGTMTRKWINSASAVGLLLVGGSTEQRYFKGGRALQRIWLTATSRGIGLQPITILTTLHARAKNHPSSLSSNALKKLAIVLSKYEELFGSMDGVTDVFLFRLHREGMPEFRSLRRPVEDILTFEDNKLTRQ